MRRSGSCRLLTQTEGSSPADETVAQALGVAQALAVLARILAGEAHHEDLDIADWTLEARLAEALGDMGLAGLDLSQPTAGLSGGERTRLRLLGLMLAAPDLLLLDEPTNHLDADARAKVHDILARWPGGAVVVSHDRELLRRMDRIIDITPLGVRVHGGGYDLYVERRDAERAAAERDLAEAERESARVSREVQAAAERQDRRDSAGRRHGASGSLPPLVAGLRASWAESGAGRARRAALQRQDDAEAARLEAQSRVERVRALNLALPRSGLPLGRTVLEASDLTWRAPDGREVIRSMNLMLTGPERVAVTGPNGSGKSTLLKLAAGTLTPAEGQIRALVPAAMLDQDLSLLQRDESLIEAFRRLNPETTPNAARAALARGLFRNVQADRRVDELSGGERLRAGLVCVMGPGVEDGARPPQLLLLDEPTNHLDLEAIEAVEAMLSEWDGALLVVSHDEDFLEAIGIDRRVKLEG